MRKLRQAWHIFFPEQPADITPKEEGKHRLRMILVADRSALSPLTQQALKDLAGPVRGDNSRRQGSWACLA